MIKIIHKKNSNKYKNVFYIGRGSVLGNPYTSIQGRETKAQFIVNSRKESIEKFREHLNQCVERKDYNVCNMFNEIYKKAIKEDVYLSCYCSPKPCHGDVIKEIIESKFKKNKDSQLNIFDN